ncbi:MAG: cbb3-type cytochrome oxidase subunit 3 [Planctomycetota bacterium]
MAGNPLEGTPDPLYGEVGLIISLVAFVIIVAYTFLGRHRADHERARGLPFDDDHGRPGKGISDEPCA